MSNVKIEISADFVRPEGESLSQALNSEVSELEQILNALELKKSEFKAKFDLLNKVRRSASDTSVKCK